MNLMTVELARLLFGLLIALFHRPLSDFIMQHERALIVLLRQRGVGVPAPPTTETARNIYFLLGISIMVIEMVRVWMLLPR